MPNYVTAHVPRPTVELNESMPLTAAVAPRATLAEACRGTATRLKETLDEWVPQTPIDIPPGTRLKCDPPEAEPPKPDMVNHPPHYTYAKYEVIDVLEEFFATNAYLWQVGKYIMRAGHKGDEMEDLLKAQFYLNRYIDYLKGEGNEETP